MTGLASKSTGNNAIHIYCQFGNFREGFNFAKLQTSRNSKITLSFTDICKLFLSCEL